MTLVHVLGALAGPSNRTGPFDYATSLNLPGPFDANRTHLFYKLAASSYCGTADVGDWNCAPCTATGLKALSKPTVYSDRATGARGFVGAFSAGLVSPEILVLSFQGSENIQNWIENIKITKTKRNMTCSGCQVHAGFYDCWKSLAAPMLAELHRLQASHSGAKVYVTGHSLGGAVAMLAAYELQYENNVTVDGVYTFGQPRVGNKAFHDFYNGGSPRVTWRLTHWHDPVPHLPLESMGFTHIGTEVFWNEKWTKHTVCDGTGEDPTCSDSVNWIGVDFSIDDHLHYFTEAIGHDACASSSATGELVEVA